MSADGEAGRALALLRSLGGLTSEECAARAGITVSELIAAEHGADETALQRLAAFHGVDADELRGANVQPAADASGATVFLLHGPYQDFDAVDLTPLTRALHGARLLAALDLQTGGQRASRRLAIRAVPCAGPRSRNAADQGRRLAWRLRTDLSLGDEPLGDLRAICEERLGIAVCNAQLSTSGLRAASILDAGRSAAAAVLSAVDPELATNSRLVRVCLAHELCHLLFDEASPGAVQIALDDSDTTRRTAKPSPTALLESRAKGFAAEFLIPRHGVATIFGGRPMPTMDRSEARRRVSLVRERFDTPWEIAALHLGNLGWIDPTLASRVREEGAGDRASLAPPAMPCDDEPPPLALQILKANPGAIDAVSPNEALARANPPSWLPSSREVTAKLDQNTSDPCLSRARDALAAGRPRAAAFAIGERLDDYLLDGAWDAAARILRDLDANEFPPSVLTAALVATRPVPDPLREARDAFFVRVVAALRTRWSLSEEEIAGIEARLR